MKLSYDATYDVLYIKFGDGVEQVVSKAVDDDITIDFDKEGKIAGIEVLDASKHIDMRKLLPVQVDKKAAS
ncbi:MAG: DUF2283 domain-containing protein [Actinobacteria bacterium]|nr:DUF2283 domain-containing protein [Actinomycetota bacterium]